MGNQVKKLRIFLADDHAVFRAGLKALFTASGAFEVVGEAGDGPTTIEKPGGSTLT
jgi:DNA-binding NarL/FixJ family response regulator